MGKKILYIIPEMPERKKFSFDLTFFFEHGPLTDQLKLRPELKNARATTI